MKRIITLLLCLSLALLCFTGCKGGEQKPAQIEADTSLKFTYDSTYADFDSSAVSAFETISKAVMNYEDFARVNVGLLDNALQLYYTSSPLSVLVKDISIKDDKSGVTITYKYDADKHKKFIADFEAKVQEIVAECSAGNATKAAYAVRAYHYVASDIVLSEDMSVSTYNAFMNHKGTSFTYSGMFEYLLAQYDISVHHVIASDASGAGWGLSAAELDGQLYYFDVMSEFYANKGEQLVYFGMTSEDVEAEGLHNLLYTNREEAATAEDMRFDICRSCIGWEIKDNNLLVSIATGDIVQVAL